MADRIGGKQPSALLPRLVDRCDALDVGLGLQGAKRELRSMLAYVRYTGDLKALAERYGLHHLVSKRMSRNQLREWIIDNHPIVRYLLDGTRVIRRASGSGRERTDVVIGEVTESGTIRFTAAHRRRR